MIDHRRERGRLARARRPGHEDQAAGLVGKAPDDRGEAELLDGRALGCDAP